MRSCIADAEKRKCIAPFPRVRLTSIPCEAAARVALCTISSLYLTSTSPGTISSRIDGTPISLGIGMLAVSTDRT